MRGGTRSNRRIFPDSVHSLMSNNANSIRNGLERMDPNERFQVYIDVQKNDEPENIRLFEEIFRENYPKEFTVAKKTLLDMVENSGRLPLVKRREKGFMVVGSPSNVDPNLLVLPEEWPTDGGKTRRNRRRRRNRRSLKHKCSKRR